MPDNNSNQQGSGFIPKNRDKFGRNFRSANYIKPAKAEKSLGNNHFPKLKKAQRIDKIPEEARERQTPPQSFINRSVERIQNVTMPQDTQIQMDIKADNKEYYYSFKRRVQNLEVILEVLPYWRSGLNMFTLVFSFFTTILSGILILANFQKLKTQLPLIYSQSFQTLEPIDKSLLFIIPVLMGFFNFMVIRLSMMIYNFDKKLVITLNLALILFNLLAIIGLVQVLSLTLL